MMTDALFKNREAIAPGYLEAVLIIKVEDKTDTEPANPAKIAKKTGDKTGVCYRYRSNPLDLTKDTFKAAISNDKYKTDECWINTIYDFYHDSLLNPNKNKRYVITGAIILEVIGKQKKPSN